MCTAFHRVSKLIELVEDQVYKSAKASSGNQTKGMRTLKSQRMTNARTGGCLDFYQNGLMKFLRNYENSQN